jgi:uncharacterized protein YPO0396
MLSLTRIYLHNWHRFNDHVIDVEDSLYLAGHNGSGKSSVLDAMQLVLVADLQRVRFNSSAQERSARNLDSYVRGKIGEGRWLRPGNTAAHVALEFTDRAGSNKTTVGVCVEAGEGKSPERTFFIVPDALDRSMFFADGRPLARRELRQALRNRRGARGFEHVGEYQEELRNRLGGLNERFFDLFLRALSFQPIRDIREFVEQWLLEARPLDVETLQRVVERLEQLRVSAHEVEAKLSDLGVIAKHQDEVRRLRERHAAYVVLTAMLRMAEAQRRALELMEQVTDLQRQIDEDEIACNQAEAARRAAEAALLKAEVKLSQSDTARRRDELQREIDKHGADADRIRQQWAKLHNDLSAEAGAARTALAAPGLDLQEHRSLHALVEAIAALDAAGPPPEELAERIDAAVTALDGALARAQRAAHRLQDQCDELRRHGEEIERELQRLRGQGRPSYPDNVERFRAMLAEALGALPPLLCQLIEVPDERWQNAVEAMLGARRFNVIVEPANFGAALRLLDQARERERLYDVGLLDLGKAGSEARRALPDSLAQKVTTEHSLLRAYLDTILGDIITCRAVDELRRHRRAITAEVVVYSEWTARALAPRAYQPWFVGHRAQRSQMESRERQLDEIRGQWVATAGQLSQIEPVVKSLSRGREWSNLRQRLDQPLDDRHLRELVADCEAELRTLDLAGVEAMEREFEALRAIAETERREELRLSEKIAAQRARFELFEEQRARVLGEVAEREQQAKEMLEQYPQSAQAAEELLQQRLKQTGRGELADAIRNAESTARNFETRASNEQQQLIEAATAYNTRYQFAAIPSNPDEPRYAAEAERLAATDLPNYKLQIEPAQREAEEELREHVLHRLREQIDNARAQLDRINEALGKLSFHDERYRFVARRADEFGDYYDLIHDSQMLRAGPLVGSEFYARHQAAFDGFYGTMTRTPTSEADRLEQEQLKDYRRYLSYDIEVTHRDGGSSRFSKIMGQTSGGETRTPFYLTIAASFVQLYHINEPRHRPTIRLVAFDEAFSKMDQDRIGATLDLFHHFGLQVITATPLERCEYLVPKMCTNLVLTSVGDSVLIEPYRNYAARLEKFYVA